MRSIEKELIKATKQYAKENRKESWKQLIITLALYVGTVVVATSAVPILLKFFSSLLIALLIVRLFAMYHDYLHGAILRKSILAFCFFTLYGYFTLNPPSIWKRSHDYHHQHNSKLHTSSIGSFPILTINQYKELTISGKLKYLFTRHPLTILFGYIFTFWIGMCLLSLIRNPKKHLDSAIALVFHSTVGWLFYVIGGSESFLFAFFLPALISSAIGTYLFYVQHNFCGATFEPKESWSKVKAAIQSTSFLKMNPVMHWFTGNIGYHHVHHLNSMIPFYNLPSAHKKFVEIQQVHRTSFNPIEISKCLRLKLWDDENHEMCNIRRARV